MSVAFATTPRGVRIAGALGGIASFALIEFVFGTSLAPEARHAASVTALMICLWMTEALPIHYTALLPLLFFPFFGVFAQPPKDPTFLLKAVLPEAKGIPYHLVRTVDAFLDANTFLFLGGMCIAAAMERWNLHRRVALTIMSLVGGGPRRLLLGMLLATAFLSLWISNTATAVMMMPIGLAVIRQMEDEEGRRLPAFGLAIMLAVAYAANVGGLGTKIGTQPNVIFCKFAAEAGQPVDFLKFLLIGLPFVALFLPILWLALARVMRPDLIRQGRGLEAIREELRKLGPMSAREMAVGAIFLLAAAAWIAGDPLSKLAGLKGTRMDALSAMSAAALLIAGGLLDRPALQRLPFSVLVLLGGSFAMAEGIGSSGLVDTLGRTLEAVSAWPLWSAFLAASAVTVALSAAASNTATTSLMMLVLRPLGVPIMATSAIAASCDFMLPAGTPPNAVVFGSGYVTVPRMMKVGFFLDVAAAALAGLWGYFGLRFILA